MNQFLKDRVDELLARTAHPLAANRTFVVDDVEGRGGGIVPLFGDVALGYECSPIEIFAGHHFLELGWIFVPAVDADQSKRLLLQFLHERPLVRPTGPSSESVLHPEIEKHDLASIVAQLEARAVLVKAFDIWSCLADGQMTDFI